MSARRSPIFNQDDPTIMEGAVRRSPAVSPAAIVRSALIDQSAPVPIVYDAADDGEQLRATELFNVPSSAGAVALPPRNFGGTALMPAAFSAEMRDAVMASMRQLEAQRAMPPASVARPSAQPQAPERPAPMGLTRFEITFAVSAAVVVGLTAALLFVYFG